MTRVERVRLTPGGHDAYGDPIPGTEDRLAIPGAFVAPRESDALNDRGRAGVVVGLTLYLPPGADVRRTDLFDVDGDRYRIDGEVGRWEHPRSGWKAGQTVALVRGEG